MKTCRFGVIGAGTIAAHFCRAVKLVEDAEVVAVASASASRAAAFAEKNGVGASYGSYEEMLLKEDLDAVYIATTHNFHMDNIRLCLGYGKHVLCEKPMVLTAADAEEAFALAKEKNLFLMEAMWSRFLPQYQKAKEWITSGRIGAVQLANVTIGFRCDPDVNGRMLNPDLAGGAMYDIGVYAIEPIQYLIGEPAVDVMGVWRPHPVTGVDERVTMILRFPSCDAALQCMINGNAKEGVVLNGTDGYIEIPFVTGGYHVRLYDSGRNLVEEFYEKWENGFVYEIEETVRCIREGRLTSDVMPPEDTVACAAIYEKILGQKPTLA